MTNEAETIRRQSKQVKRYETEEGISFKISEKQRTREKNKCMFKGEKEYKLYEE